MQNAKELTLQEMKKINGGNSCTNGTSGGAIADLPGDTLSVLAGAADCIKFGYNENPKHGQN